MEITSKIYLSLSLGGARGQATDIKIHADRIIQMREDLNRKLALHSGQSYEKVCLDTERDNFMTAQQALEYGLIDSVIQSSWS